MHFMQDVAGRLRAFMDRNGLSQAQLAEKAGVSQPTVSRALSGKGERRGAARSRLFSYVGISEYPPSGAKAEALDRSCEEWEGHMARENAERARIVGALAKLTAEEAAALGWLER